MATLPRLIRNALAATLAGGLLLALPAAPAAAHDRLKSSNPAKNAKVSNVETITLDYTSKIRFPAVALRRGDEKIGLGKPRTEGTEVSVEVTEPLAPGAYVIAWRVVSIDGHPIEGEIPFTVKESPSPSPTPTPSASESAPAEAATPTPVTTFSPAGSEEESRQGGVPGWLWVAGGVLVIAGAVVWLGTGRKGGDA